MLQEEWTLNVGKLPNERLSIYCDLDMWPCGHEGVEIAVEVAASADLTAVDQMEETVDRQLEEIDDQMR